MSDGLVKRSSRSMTERATGPGSSVVIRGAVCAASSAVLSGVSVRAKRSWDSSSRRGRAEAPILTGTFLLVTAPEQVFRRPACPWSVRRGVWQARDMAGFRVTYATMSADDAELNAAYDAAVESVRGELGAQHPLWIGDDERFGEAFTTVSPLDTSVGDRALHAGRRQRHRRRRRRGATSPPGLGGDAVAGAVRDPRSRRRPDLRALDRRRRGARLRERQEPARGDRRGRGVRRSDPLLHARDARARRVRDADAALPRGRGHHRRDAAVRGVGGDRAVQLPVGADRRPGRAPRS